MSGSVDHGRRRVLAGLAVATTFSILSPYTRSAGVDYPFTLGVASGDPLPDGFVIWTRLAPLFNAVDGRGGLSRAVPVRWRVASDVGMTRIVRQGEVMTSERFAHSVHVEVAGLQAGRPYWYQFEGLGAQSPVGQARTAPPVQAMTSARVGFVSCSHWERGYFSAYRHLAAEQPDLVFFLGDYIYDSSYAPDSGKVFRAHGSGNAVSLSDYRNRYALYKTDPDLQALHAAAPSVATWDDHEVLNDYAGLANREGLSAALFARRRAAAYRTYFEHMPIRPSLWRGRREPHGVDARRRSRQRTVDEHGVADAHGVGRGDANGVRAGGGRLLLAAATNATVRADLRVHVRRGGRRRDDE